MCPKSHVASGEVSAHGMATSAPNEKADASGHGAPAAAIVHAQADEGVVCGRLMAACATGLLDALIANASLPGAGSGEAVPKDSFSNALAKNIVAMTVWLALSVINGSMVHTFLKHSVFYDNPRYIMFIYMVVNDALQLSLVTTLYMLSYIFRRIHASFCCLLIMTAVLTTRSTPLILAGMAVERYVSICFPLHYSQMCTVPRTLLLVGAILMLTATPPITDLLITVLKEPPSFFHDAIFCDHSLLFRHRSIYYKNFAFDGVYLSFVFLTLVFTYCKIMMTARAASAGLVSVTRARNTVLLHGLQLLLCLLAFVVPSLQAALISLFPLLSLEIRYIFFLLVYIIPRFLSPVVYGFRDKLFRKYWTRYLACQSLGNVRVDGSLA
ncbi:odorant receptor 131-2-like [Entelurus aequoreus]|uniref:odorant receptor 131-2-like n=1 Tax=Entelurus aequoreus TaxID=161455 RepID=UPI002B1D1C65|nr:odorant receptor 131-2-like [Entelurus aequoreus]